MTGIRAGWVAMCALAPGLAWAAPHTFNNQGRLFDETGTALSGAHDLTFTFYDAETFGTDLWDETFHLTLDEGWYQVVLGNDGHNAFPEDLLDHDAVFLAIRVDTDPEITPRQRLVAVPYALVADTAHAVKGGVVEADSIVVGGQTVIDQDGNFMGTIAGGSLGDLSCSDGQVPVWDEGFSAWGCVDRVIASEIHALAEEVCFDQESELVALLDDNYLKVTWRPKWGDLDNIPPSLLDGDDDTTYTAGAGVNLVGPNQTEIELDTAAVQSIAEGVCFDSLTELRAALDGVYLGIGDVPELTLDTLCAALGGTVGTDGVCIGTSLGGGGFGTPDPGPTPAPVPATVSWAADSESGNSACARVHGVCTGAADGGGTAIACGTNVSSGSASCAASSAMDGSTNWPGYTWTGESMCTRILSTCVAAYAADGTSITCATPTLGGVAACKRIVNGMGWDRYAMWSGDSESGGSACAMLGATCVSSYDATGLSATCGLATAYGTARCLQRASGSVATWTGDSESGDSQCAKGSGVCAASYASDGNSILCSTTIATGVALCNEPSTGEFGVQWSGDNETSGSICTRNHGVCARSWNSAGDPVACDSATTAGTGWCKAPTDWEFSVTWSGDNETGGSICARADADCVRAFNVNGNAIPCDSADSYGTGQCKPATTWNTHVVWSGDNETGGSMCARSLSECVKAFNVNGNSIPCDSADSYGTASCRPKSDFDKSYTWAGDNETGGSICTRHDGDCVRAYNVNGNAIPCDSADSYGTTTCLDRTTWDFPVVWAGDNETGDSYCTRSDGECLRAFNVNGNAIPCISVDSYGTAKCVATDGSDWNFHVVWPADVETGDSVCTRQIGECFQMFDVNGNAIPCSSSTNDFVVRCRTVDPGWWWDDAATWAGNFTGDERCASRAGTCVQAFNALGVETTCSTAGPGTARCLKD